MMSARLILLLALAAAPAGCASSPNLTPSQLSELQTRRIDAPSDVAFRSVVGVMLDRGMFITLSDGGAGLVGAMVGPNGQACCNTTSGNPLGAPAAIVVWVRADPAGGSMVRVQFSHCGLAAHDREPVSRFVDDVDRRTLRAPAARSMR